MDKPRSLEYTWYNSQTTWSSRRKPKVWVLRSFLEGVTKYSWKKILRQSVEQRLKERPSMDCPTWRSNPYIVTKGRHYCRCQEEHSNRSLITDVSWETLPEPNKEVDNCSQPLTDHGVPNGGVKERTQGAKRVCNPIERTTISTTQDSQGLNH